MIVHFLYDTSQGVGRIVKVLVLGAIAVRHVQVFYGVFRFLVPIVDFAVEIQYAVLVAVAGLRGIYPEWQFCVCRLGAVVVPVHLVVGLLVRCFLHANFGVANNNVVRAV